MATTIELCGAFQARVVVRKGETSEQAAARAEESIQRALDAHARRYGVVIGIDFGDIRAAIKKATD